MSFRVEEANNGLARTMTTFSGCDIKAYFENVEIGNLQGISLSVNREVRPVFAMGRTDVLSYSRGKRGVAGSLIMTVFDRDAFYDIKQRATFAAKKTDLTADGTGGLSGVAFDVDSVGTSLQKPNYSDQIPPFNVTLVATNEFGNAMVMRIHGVHLVSEGQGMSVDDNVAESQMTFVAHSVNWWTPLHQDLLGTQVPFDGIGGLSDEPLTI